MIDRLTSALADRYGLERELGQGGMATVFLADDLKHGRKVAIKVLKPELAAAVGSERFLAEIRTTAKLQHPHILPLHDSGEADGFLFYVMPYVEGESLRDRLDREHQLPVDAAIRIAEKVATALDYSHRHGVVHRDIKPANIMVTGDEPLIADFGIALAVTSAGGGRLTETGLSLGTPHYMSPEQATGEEWVGPEADVYALGCVLYEMLVGEPPYTGASPQAILAKIITQDPARATEYRKAVPSNVDSAIRRALEKLPADRFDSASGFASALRDPHFTHGLEAGGASATGNPAWKRITVALAGVATLLAVALGVAVTSDRPAPPEVVRFTIPVSKQDSVYLGGAPTFGRPFGREVTFAPDGGAIAFAATGPRGSQLYLRRLDQDVPTPIPGTEGTAFPGYSLDGEWLAYATRDGGVYRMSLAQGDVATVVHPGGFGWPGISSGGALGEDGTIMVTYPGALVAVPETGGQPVVVAEAPEGSTPGESVRLGGGFFLPGSEVLLLHGRHSSDPSDADILAFDRSTGEFRTIMSDGMDPRYLPTGHLVFVRQGVLMGIRFDPESLQVEGDPVALVADVMQSVFMPNTDFETGVAQFAISPAGHLVFARGGVYPERADRVVRLTPDGDTIPLELEPGGWNRSRVSPDGNFIAMGRGRAQASEIWIHDLARGQTRRLQAEGFWVNSPVWSPDGRMVAFHSDHDGAPNVYVKAADGSGEARQIAPSDQEQIPLSWSRDGVLAFWEAGDIWVAPPDEDPRPFFTSEGWETHADFSPDGEWLLYVAPDGAIYVRPYPASEPRTLIAEAGISPSWSRDGGQVHYLSGTSPNVMMTVAVDTDDGVVTAGRPTPMMEWGGRPSIPARDYDVFPDGSFLAFVGNSGARAALETFGTNELHVVLNWFEEVKERMGDGR